MITRTLAAILLGSLALSAWAEGDAAAGKQKSAVCAACHQADGNSTNPEWPKLAGQHAGYIVKQLSDYKAQESRNNALMAGQVASLSDQDMMDLAAWFSTQSASGGFMDEGYLALGKRIFQGGNAITGVPACMSCHGPSGMGDPIAGFPRLAGQHAAYIEGQLEMFRLQTRSNDARRMMRDVAIKMTPTEMAAVAAYIGGLY